MEIIDKFKFIVANHDKVNITVDEVLSNPACHFCGEVPIVIVYRGWNDKVVSACEKHEEIVKEMIERDGGIT